MTDLGTEFGVTVLKDGLTQVHVLRGAVDARIVDPRGSAPRHQRVTEGLAVEIGRKGARIDTVAFAPRSFTRRLDAPIDTAAEAAYINAVLADKPLGYWPLNEPAGVRTFLDRPGNGFRGFAMKTVVAGQPGPLSNGPHANGSHAVGFQGNGCIDFGRHDEFAMANDLPSRRGFASARWADYARLSRLMEPPPIIPIPTLTAGGWTGQSPRGLRKPIYDPFEPILGQ